MEGNPIKLNRIHLPSDAPKAAYDPNRKALKRFLRYVIPYWPLIGGATLCGIMKFVLPSTMALSLKYLTDRLATATAGTGQPEGGSDVVARGLDAYVHWAATMLPDEWVGTAANASNWTAFNILMVSLVVLYAFWGVSLYFRSYLAQRAGHRVILDLRTDLYQHITRMGHAFFQTRQSGGIVSRLMSDIALAQNFVGNAMTNIWMDLAACVFYLYVLFSMDVPLALASLCVFPFYILSMRTLGRRSKLTSKAVQEAMEEFSGDVQERVSGISVVKAFGTEQREARSFFAGARKLFHLTMTNVKTTTIANTIVQWLTQMATLGLIWYGGWRLYHNYTSVGTVVAFILLIRELYFPINRISEMNTILHNSLAAIDRIFEIFDIQPDVRDKPDAKRLALQGRITFEDVTFAYPLAEGIAGDQAQRHKGTEALRGADAPAGAPSDATASLSASAPQCLGASATPTLTPRPVLHNLTLDIAPGEIVALVGPSGAGKSTIVQLVPRFYDPQRGTIRIDGYDLKDLHLRTLRCQIGMVAQETLLFSGTVRENLLYGRPDASEEELFAAATAANAHEFITALPEGYETLLGERGAKLSGGQKQRLAIARAFLTNPRILILDEATSALDSESEHLIQEALSKLMEGRTNIVIAHRLSTILNSDRIVVLDQGRIVDIGPHTELLARGGLYARLYHTQFRTAMAG